MSNKKTLLLSILAMLTVLILLAAIIFFVLNRNEKQLQENMRMIKSNYAGFSTNISDNDQIRQKLTNYIEEFKDKKLEDEEGHYVETLKKYDKNIKYLDSLVKDMESRCKHKYEDLNINILCKGYAGLYESTINKYIAKVTEYNNLVIEYNKTANTSHKTHKLVYEQFIDYNKDGEYAGSK